MRKFLKKLGTVLLCVAVACSFTVNGFALSAKDYAVLNIVFAPNGTPVNTEAEGNQVEYRAYKLADAARAEDGDGFVYTLADGFTDCDIDLNELIGGSQAANGIGSDEHRELLSLFGSYINEHPDTVEPVQTQTTGPVAIGTAGENRDGVAQFKSLSDGLYLFTSSAAIWLNGTRYTPVPFIVNIPYVFDGAENNYLTATIKFTTYTPSPDPSEPDPGTTDPAEPVNPDDPADPTEPTDPVNPTDPADPTNPDDPSIDIPDPDVPTTDAPITEILPEDVPLTDQPELDHPDIEIPDGPVPMTRLPQTGLLWWPVPVLAAAGVICVGAGVIRRKRDRDA